MTWMITITGREHHLTSWQKLANTPTIEEVAHSLALINRFTGHTHRPYSVAEHSLLVLHIARIEGASPAAQMAALLHDAHEAFVGDVSSPVKWTVGEPWDAFEHGQATALQSAFQVRSTMVAHRASVRRWDLTALATERRDLTAYNPATCAPWAILDTPGQVVHPMEGEAFDLNSRVHADASWQDWREAFLREYDALQRLMGGLARATA